MLSKKDFERATDGDDVFFCELEYASDEKKYRLVGGGLVEGVGDEGELSAVGGWAQCCNMKIWEGGILNVGRTW